MIAGAAIRYREVHRREVEDIVALDIALRRNDREWVEQLPQDVERDVVHTSSTTATSSAMCSTRTTS